MYKEYKKIKKNIRVQGRTIKPIYFMLLLIVLISGISIGYSYWNTQLSIKGKVTTQNDNLPVELPDGTIDDGVTRFTEGETHLTSPVLGREVFEIISETKEADTITTNIKVVEKYHLIWDLGANLDITLILANNSGYDFTNGKVVLIEENIPMEEREFKCART